MKIKVLGTEAACGTSTTNGSNFGSSTAVRLVNSGTTDRLVSVETSGNSDNVAVPFESLFRHVHRCNSGILEGAGAALALSELARCRPRRAGVRGHASQQARVRPIPWRGSRLPRRFPCAAG